MPWRIREVISDIQPGRDWFGNMNFFFENIYTSQLDFHTSIRYKLIFSKSKKFFLNISLADPVPPKIYVENSPSNNSVVF